MAQLVQHGLGVPRGSRSRSLEFRLIFGVSFLVFLVAAVAGRLLPGQAVKESRQASRSIGSSPPRPASPRPCPGTRRRGARSMRWSSASRS